MLRKFPVNAFPRSRAVAFHTPARRVNLAMAGHFSKPLAGTVYKSVSLTGRLTNSYATATGSRGRSAGTKGRAKAKTSTTSKAKKTAKKSTKASAKKKPSKKPAKRPVLSERQKELRKLKEKRALIAQLKKTALRAPKKLSTSKFVVALQESFSEASETQGPPPEKFKKAVELARTLVDSDAAVRSSVFLSWLIGS